MSSPADFHTVAEHFKDTVLGIDVQSPMCLTFGGGAHTFRLTI